MIEYYQSSRNYRMSVCQWWMEKRSKTQCDSLKCMWKNSTNL